MIRFLQISDIHFTDKDGNDDEYRQMKCKFLEDIASCYASLGKIDYILICGDVAFSGLDSQYKIARAFIDEICKKADCESVFIVPGNHDKKWDVYSRTRQAMRDTLLTGKSTKLLLESKVKEPMAVGILYAPFRQYYKLAEEHLCISDFALKSSLFPVSDQEGIVPKFKPNDAMYWTQDLGTIKGFHLFIHGSNTSLLSDKDDGDSKNWKDGKHLQVVPLQAYNITAASDEIHLLMLHHPMSEVADGKAIEKDLDGRFIMQLYGHVHRQSSSDSDVIKIYSGALQPEEDDSTEYFPVYNVIELDVADGEEHPNLKVNIFSRKWDGAKFDVYTEETKIGDKALVVALQKNDAWEKTMKEIKSGKDTTDVEPEKTINPYAVKNRFLRCGREGEIIKKMYKNQFDGISPNRTKYIVFLKQVENDGRIQELNEILNGYDK